MRIIHSRPSVRLLLGAALLVAVACSDMLLDPAEPGGPALALQLGAEGGADGLAKAFSKADGVRVVLTEGGITAKEVVLAFASDGEETRLRIPVETALVGKPLGLSLELLRGEAPLFRGDGSVLVQPGSATPVAITLRPIASGMLVADSFPVLESLGDELRLAGAVVLATGDTVPGVVIRWRALDGGPVEVSADGRAVARREGEARVEASAERFMAITRVRVRQKPAQVEVRSSSSVLGVGGSETLKVTLRDARGNEITGRGATWVSSNPSVVSVDSAGRVRAVSVGTATITASAEGASGSVEVTVGRPRPVVTELQPRHAVEGAGALTLRVLGRGFDDAAVVLWDGAARPSSFVSPTELRAAISASDLATARTVQVAVRAPAPGGGVSDALSFQVVAPTPAPVPVVYSLSPARRTAGQGAFTMTITGRDFTGSTVANWNGSVRPTTFVSSTELRVTVLASDVDTHGTARVFVSTPMPGGGVSGTLSFTIESSARIALSPTAIAFGPASGHAVPAARAVEISNGGVETLSGLSATITYSGSVTGWLTAALSGTTAPASVTLRPNTTSIPAGTHTAVLTVRSSLPGVPEQSVTISYTVDSALVSLSVTGSGYASGTVTSTPAGISCTVSAGSTSGTCSGTFPEGSVVRLVAEAGASSAFRYWTDACAAAHSSTCDLALNASTSTGVRFESSVAPVIVVRAVESLTPTSATLSADVTLAVAEPFTFYFEANPVVADSAVITRYCGGEMPAGTTRVSCDVAGLTPGTDYEYRVVVVGMGSGLMRLEHGSFMTPEAPPALSFVIHHTWLYTPPYVGMQVEWTSGSTAVTSFVLERRRPLDSDFVSIASLPATTLRYVDDTTSEGTVYRYRVQGCSATGCRASNEISQRTLLLPATELSATDAGEGVRLTWTNHSQIADSVEITRRKDGTDETETFRTAVAEAGDYFDGTIARGTTYTYTIRACRASFGCSASVSVTISIREIFAAAWPLGEPDPRGPGEAPGTIPRSGPGVAPVWGL